MMTFKKYLLAASAICMMGGATLATKAFAEYKPNKRDTSPTREQLEELGFTGILPQDDAVFTFMRPHDAEEHDIVLKVSIPVTLQGCYKVLPLELSYEIQGKVLVVTKADPIVMVDRKKKNCVPKSEVHGAKLTLDRDELLDAGVNMMRLKSSKGGNPRVFKMEIEENLLRLIPKSGNPLNRTLEYWFAPSNTVMISAPMAKEDIYYNNNMLQDIALIAEDNGLVPIEEDLPEFLPRSTTINRYYFLDKDGDLIKALKKGKKTISVGTITRTEPFYGPNGKYDKQIPIDVIATLPGEYD